MQKFVEREVREGLDDQVRFVQGEARGDRVRDRDAEEPGCLRRLDPVQRVLEGDRLPGFQAEPVQRLQVEVRSGFCPPLVAVRARGRVPDVLDSEPADVGEHPRVACAADDRNVKTASLGGLQVVLDALAQPFGVRELEIPLLVPREQRVAVEGPAGQPLELPNRVEPLREGADVRQPVRDEQLMPVLLVDLAPGAVGAGLGVDEQPVEVEEQAAYAVAGQVQVVRRVCAAIRGCGNCLSTIKDSSARRRRAPRCGRAGRGPA